MIDLPPLPVPIEEMFFYSARQDDGKVRIIGAYSDPSSAGVTYLVVGTYPDHRTASAILDEVVHVQTLTKALLK